MNACRFIVVLALSVPYQFAFAADALLDFSASMRSFTADFTQTVYDSDSIALQESSGKVVLQRPGKFRWSYDQPIQQLIVADGVTLWVYDEDIQQVTMQPQSTTLGSAPIGLLSGERAIESEFNVVDLGVRDDLQWFQLEPLVQDTDFNAVYIALDSAGLRAMELRDNFDQATQIRFSNFKLNAIVAPSTLTFVPPEGVDVVGEAGVSMDNPVATDSAVDDRSIVQPDVVTPSPVPEAQVQPVETAVEEPVETLPADELAKDVVDTEEPVVVDDAPPIAETLPLEDEEEVQPETDTEKEITFEETIVPTE